MEVNKTGPRSYRRSLYTSKEKKTLWDQWWMHPWLWCLPYLATWEGWDQMTQELPQFLDLRY